MTSKKFAHKRIGYLAGCQSFHQVHCTAVAHLPSARDNSQAPSSTPTPTSPPPRVALQDTDVLMLTTNMIKKDLGAQNMYEAGLALNGLANFVTHDLARCVWQEHSRRACLSAHTHTHTHTLARPAPFTSLRALPLLRLCLLA